MCLNQNKLTSQAKNHEQTKIIKWLNIEKMYNMIYLYRFLNFDMWSSRNLYQKGSPIFTSFQGLNSQPGHLGIGSSLRSVLLSFFTPSFVANSLANYTILKIIILHIVILQTVILQTIILHTVFLQIVISRLTYDWCFFFVPVGG